MNNSYFVMLSDRHRKRSPEPYLTWTFENSLDLRVLITPIPPPNSLVLILEARNLVCKI